MYFYVCAANLEVNEKIKSDLNPVRINEPKTPYRGPMDADEEDALGNNSCCALRFVY
jgi:Protein phosphatase inhibitor 2 (IPP-2)